MDVGGVCCLETATADEAGFHAGVGGVNSRAGSFDGGTFGDGEWFTADGEMHAGEGDDGLAGSLAKRGDGTSVEARQAPPARMMSALPKRICSAAMAMALAEEAQVAETVKQGPCVLK